MKLFIGNKNYSSWSFRAWIGLRAAGIEFEEHVRLLDQVPGNAHLREFSPSGLVPVLVDGDLTIWESLAILEYAADAFGGRGLWPESRTNRALARSVAHEMHAGFAALRKSCPMNIRRPPRSIELSDAVRRDVARIETIWRGCLERSGGPFLFGGFTAADAMYAPVVNRFQTYKLSEAPHVERYGEAMNGLDAWQEWEKAAIAEPWTIEAEEV